jgi:hypothetical protein
MGRNMTGDGSRLSGVAGGFEVANDAQGSVEPFGPWRQGSPVLAVACDHGIVHPDVFEPPRSSCFVIESHSN